jgi:hypothetical protein
MQATQTTRRRVLTATAGFVGAAMAGGMPRRSYARQEAVTLRWWDYYTTATVHGCQSERED